MEYRNYNTKTGELGPELNTDFQTEREIIENCIFKARQLHFDGLTPSDIDVKKIEDELYDRLFSYRDNKKETPLNRPAAYSLIDIFKELKFGRPAASQKYLDKCIKELHNDSCLDSGDDKLPNFKFTPPPKDEYHESKLKNYLRELIFKARRTGMSEYASECLQEVNQLIDETFSKLFIDKKIKPYGYSEGESYESFVHKNKEDETPYGYMLIKPENQQEVYLIIGSEFLNTDGIHIRQPENIKKLLDAGVLNEWFVPVFKYDEQELTFGFPDGFMNIGITTDGYLIADTNNSADWRQLKFKLPKGKGTWVLFSHSTHSGKVTLHNLTAKGNEELIQDSMGKTIIDGSKLRPYNRIDVLSSSEGKMNMDDLDGDLTKIALTYAHDGITKKDLELSVRIMVDIIRNPQFYLKD